MASVLKQQAGNRTVRHGPSATTMVKAVLGSFCFSTAIVAFAMGVWAGFAPYDPSSIDTPVVWFLTSLMLFLVGDIGNILRGKRSVVLDELPTLWKRV